MALEYGPRQWRGPAGGVSYQDIMTKRAADLSKLNQEKYMRELQRWLIERRNPKLGRFRTLMNMLPKSLRSAARFAGPAGAMVGLGSALLGDGFSRGTPDMQSWQRRVEDPTWRR